MTGSNEKAAHYISLLDNARVNASWADLPELIRKVNKHAPQRKVLTQTAAAEHEVAVGVSTSVGRPSTSSGSRSTPLSTLSTTLRSEDDSVPEDLFQGKTCLLWSRWTVPDDSAGTTGFDIATAVKSLDGKDITTWTKICIVKSAYIEGTSYIRNGRPTEAQRVFETARSYLQSNRELVLSTPQLAYWAEQLLAQQALSSAKEARADAADGSGREAIKYWTVIASKTKESSASMYKNSAAHLTRFTVWERYFQYLSAALSKHAQLPPTVAVSTSVRSEQAAELKKVQRAYENELFRVVKFPTATETNKVVERWVEQAASNWQILCGPQWHDAELGEGGRDAVARNMLDILYRAATKTFQSTLILRRLFQVHLSLAEFELAYRAFDTYVELVERARIKSAKASKIDTAQESDATVMAVVSEAITALCKFGLQLEARKAYDLSLKLEDWLAKVGVEVGDADPDAETLNGHTNGAVNPPSFEPQLLQTVYRAIGTGKAHWARWTPVSENRSGLQEDALNSLRKASAQGDPQIETLYAMSLLLAETRDIPSAIQVAKSSLARNTADSTQSLGWIRERKLISQWHLLALLLSSRQDFDSAAKSCVAAFEQFASSDLRLGPGRNSSVSSNIEKQFNTAVSSFVDDLGCDELQRIIEVRITELALTELVDGPEEAVNCSNELLSLFSRLFAHFQIALETASARRNLLPPKSSAGTVKSTRTSIFGRKKLESQAGPITEKGDDAISTTTNGTRPSTRATHAPTIEVTNDDEKQPGRKYLRKSYDGAHNKASAEKGSHKLSSRLSQRSTADRSSQAVDQKLAQEQPQSISAAPLPTLTDDKELSAAINSSKYDKSTENKREVSEDDRDLVSQDTTSPPVIQGQKPLEQNVNLPSSTSSAGKTSPPPRFPKSVAQKQTLAILVKVWLVIAMLYRRASMFEDSKEACEEAAKAISRMENIAGSADHSARASAGAGGAAGVKSSDEMWADIHCERAELQLAIHQRKVKEGKPNNNEELRTALDNFEQCLMFTPNHPAGIIGLSNILLDSYERKVDLSRRINNGRLQIVEKEKKNPPDIVVSNEGPAQQTEPVPSTTEQQQQQQSSHKHPHPQQVEEDLRKTPENLNRIAARDRAYGLLSTLTKLGSGWDNSEAWFALARAHELSGEVDRARDVLWWCVELEDSRPIRHWQNLGYVL